MPLSAKGREIMAKLKSEYGEAKGKSVFYAMRNAGKLTGVDEEEVIEDEGEMPSTSFNTPPGQGAGKGVPLTPAQVPNPDNRQPNPAEEGPQPNPEGSPAGSLTIAMDRRKPIHIVIKTK